jgi:hypothetical protein
MAARLRQHLSQWQCLHRLHRLRRLHLLRRYAHEVLAKPMVAKWVSKLSYLRRQPGLVATVQAGPRRGSAGPLDA